MKNGKIRTGLKAALMATLVLSLLPTMGNAQFSYKGLCDGVTATVDITAISHSSGVVDGEGTWAVGGGADGVRLEYYIDDVPYQTESDSGTSGNWDFADDYSNSCTHVFKVIAYPMVSSTTCWQHGTSDSDYFRVGAPQAEITSCSWNSSSCESSIANGTCTGNYGSPDCSSDEPYWGLNGSGFTKGSWVQAITCRPKRDTVGFKVKDKYTGAWSDDSTQPCCAE